MDWGSLVAFFNVALTVFLVVQLVRFVVADADLTLLWKERYGLKPEILEGKVIWITGASSGIGEQLAYRLARARTKLVLSARRTEELQRVRKQCLMSGNIREEDIMVLPLDSIAFSTHSDAVQQVLKQFGRIDILVNNSGRSQRSMAEDTDLAVHQEMMDVNYTGVISLTKAVLPHFMERKQGHIVVTSSVAGKLGAPLSASYSATKFALQGWFDTLRIEVAPEYNIDITMVCPGPVVSNILKTAFTGKQGEMFDGIMQPGEKRVTGERCADLMAIAMANRLDEVWIALHPVLLFTYISQYCPGLGRMMGKRLGMKMIKRIRDGKV